MYRAKQTVFAQGDPADAVFYLRSGQIQLIVVSRSGKEAIMDTVEAGSFFGESCLAGRSARRFTARATKDAAVVRIAKNAMLEWLRREPDFAEVFIAYLLSHSIRIEEDLIDQLFNPSEKRLARLLLRLAHVDKDAGSGRLIPKISQETLGEMIGATRSRVSFFMNRFREMGFVEYQGGDLRVHEGLLTVVLRD